MSDESAPEPEDEPQIDPVQLQFALEQARSRQNLFGAVLAGGVAAAAGAGVWAAVTVFTGYQVGVIAIAIGFLVGYAVRLGGNGVDAVYGVIGGSLALLGCAGGNLLALCAILAQQQGIPLADVLSQLGVNAMAELMVASFDPMDLLFYGFAAYEGYKLSIRELTVDDLQLGPTASP